MTNYFKPASSINAKIKDTEQQILNHQQAVDRGTDALAGKIQQQRLIPANLVLAASIGFILGELTQPRCHPTDKPDATETSPLKTALSLIGSARTLYGALPIALMMKSRYQTDASEQGMRGKERRVHE